MIKCGVGCGGKSCARYDGGVRYFARQRQRALAILAGDKVLINSVVGARTTEVSGMLTRASPAMLDLLLDRTTGSP